jgi:hypothetical protein
MCRIPVRKLAWCRHWRPSPGDYSVMIPSCSRLTLIGSSSTAPRRQVQARRCGCRPSEPPIRSPPQEIANIEAYVLSLNGVDAAKIIHPGITPLRFVEGTVALFAVALLVIGGLWVHCRVEHPCPPRRRDTRPRKNFQALQHEVADLKHKLEEMETRNPKDSSGSIDSQP